MKLPVNNLLSLASLEETDKSIVLSFPISTTKPPIIDGLTFIMHYILFFQKKKKDFFF